MPSKYSLNKYSSIDWEIPETCICLQNIINLIQLFVAFFVVKKKKNKNQKTNMFF